MKRKPPLPRSFDLPGGYHIKILYVGTGEHRLSEANNGEWLAGDGGGKILIRKTLSRAKKLEVLMYHEMQHAFADWQLWAKQKYE